MFRERFGYSYEYDDDGNVTKSIGPDGNTTAYTYGNGNSDVTEMTLPGGQKIYTIEEITSLVLRDMNHFGICVRIVSSPSDRLSNEYIVAMRISDPAKNKGALGENTEYHFAVQLGNGTWADKPGGASPRWNQIDGSAAAWDFAGIPDYYSLGPVYFAVERW